MSVDFESSPKSPGNLLPLIALPFHCPVIHTVPEPVLFQEDRCLPDQICKVSCRPVNSDGRQRLPSPQCWDYSVTTTPDYHSNFLTPSSRVALLGKLHSDGNTYKPERTTLKRRWLKPSLLDQRHASPRAPPAVPQPVRTSRLCPASFWGGLMSKELLGTKGSQRCYSLTLWLQAEYTGDLPTGVLFGD